MTRPNRCGPIAGFQTAKRTNVVFVPPCLICAQDCLKISTCKLVATVEVCSDLKLSPGHFAVRPPSILVPSPAPLQAGPFYHFSCLASRRRLLEESRRREEEELREEIYGGAGRAKATAESSAHVPSEALREQFWQPTRS